MRYLIAAAAAVCSATPALAMNVIEAEAGEACAITTTGWSTCIWTAVDGGTTTADVNVDMASGYNYLSGNLSIYTAAISGLVTVEIPYLSATWKPAWREQLIKGATWGGFAASPNDRLIGTVSVNSVMDGVIHKTTGVPCSISGTKNTKLLGGFVTYSNTEVCIDEADGIWTAAIDWNFRSDTKLSRLFYYETHGVPEPATWAMFIAGFGLVGAAARRSRNRLTAAPST